MQKTSITEQQLDLLNAFCGYGALPQANIIFLGNEEGFDYKHIQQVLDIRMKRAKNNILIDGENILNGHYTTEDDEESSSKIIQMIQYQSRLLLHLNDPSKNWFEPSGANEKAWGIIKDYHFNHIYHEGPAWKYKSALTELRPLPRRNEGEWPFDNIDRESYIEAFQFGTNPSRDEKIENLKKNRVKLLKKVFSTGKDLKLIIGIGDKVSKKNFFENEFGITLSTLQFDRKTFFEGSMHFDNRKFTILLADFFGNGQLGLAELKSLGDHLVGIGF